MPRKKSTVKNDSNKKDELATTGKESTKPANASKSTTVKEDPDAKYKILLESTASKLSPKSEGKIHYQIAKNTDDDQVYLRMDKTDGGGLHTREWISVQAIVDAVSIQDDRPFKSDLT